MTDYFSFSLSVLFNIRRRYTPTRLLIRIELFSLINQSLLVTVLEECRPSVFFYIGLAFLGAVVVIA